MNGLGTAGDPALPRRPDPARLRRRPARPCRRRRCAARGIVLEIERDVAGDRAGGGRPARSRVDNGETPRRRPGALRHRPQSRTPRASGSRRSASAAGANGAVVVDDWSQTAVPSIYAVGDVTDRVRADAGGDPRGPGLRRDGVRRPARGRLDHTPDPDGGLHPARGGDRRPDRGRRRAARGPVEVYRDALPADAAHAVAAAAERMLMKLVVDGRQPQGARRPHRRPRRRRDDPARGRRGPHGRDQGRFRPRRWRCIRPRPRNWSPCARTGRA